MADEDRDYAIRHRAYALWEQAGRPDGEHRKFWDLAEKKFDDDHELEEGLGETFPASDTPTSLMRSGSAS